MAFAYATVLILASGMTADPAAGEAVAGQVAGVLPAAQPEADAVQSIAATPASVAEQPLVTLALATAMAALAALAYLVHLVHGRLGRRAGRQRESLARLVARQITTLL